MKKYFSIVIIYLIFASCLYSQVPPPIQENISIGALSNSVYKNTVNNIDTFSDFGTYDMGGHYSAPNKRIFRSYFNVSLSSIPTNATINSVTISYITSGSSSTIVLVNGKIT
ncbi:MAG: hypothetical protein M0P71_14645 [Melioribacteraceae bacterium]|nr:hypothetical protein [Melioribacteraceae bacterium]